MTLAECVFRDWKKLIQPIKGTSVHSVTRTEGWTYSGTLVFLHTTTTRTRKSVPTGMSCIRCRNVFHFL